MIKSHRSQTPLNDKPEKPYPDFPLYAHRNGCWAKKIRGKTYFFGPWRDPDRALEEYLRQKDDLHAGRKPGPAKDLVTVKELANEFLNAKQALVDGGELSPRTWDDYKRVCDLLVDRIEKNRLVCYLRPEDFTELRKFMAAKWGPVRLANMIKYVRSVFKFAFDADLIDKPTRFGPGFTMPSRKTIRQHRAQQGPKLFSQDEIRAMIDAAGSAMKAMILLGINCGFGNADCGQLPLSAVNLDAGWIDFPRPKTGIPRRCPLWPETVAAIKEYLEHRPIPKKEEYAGLVFVTTHGLSWHKDVPDSPVSKEMAKLLRRIGINGRKGVSFYCLRHCFQTIGDESKDPVAVSHIMGHEIPGMANVYREKVSDERLRAVVNVVRDWLFAK